ncbi:MAG: response regulator [Tagaea sp.]|jgi:CheY-like chemotaxis protein|nr:response regulator [Azospirillum sp.]MCA3267492.1 response regulator [Azospirillum sp.]MCZ8125274.1 response regulator [Magnetospirillum sp.]
MTRPTLSRILLVEDDPDIREIAEMALGAVGGFETLACASGGEALRRLGAFAPQLAVVDVMMPGMDGPGLLAALRARPDTAALPVVFMTAKVQPEEMARWRGLGAIEVVAKPFDPMKLADRLREVWAKLDG